jgi:hypothetical protein
LAGAEKLSTSNTLAASQFVSYEEEEAHQQQQQQQQARQKETQNINKSLSCLGDVVMALSNTPLSLARALSLSLSLSLSRALSF